MSELEIPGRSPFDQIRQIRPDGSEFWSARDLMALMSYAAWQNFQPIVEKAWEGARHVGLGDVEHFMAAHKVAASGPAAKDVHLSRLAAYLVTLAADEGKPRVAEAKLYFAIKTREAEAPAEMDELEFAERHLQTVKAKRAAEARALAAEEKVKELEPKAANFDAFLSTDSTQRMDIVAKEFGMTAITLFAILRDEGVLMEGGRRHNVPYAAHMKHFKIVAQTYETNTRGTQSTSTTYVRPSGYDLIRRVLDRRKRRQEVEAFHQRGLEAS